MLPRTRSAEMRAWERRTPPKPPLKRIDQSETANRKPPTNHRHSLLTACIVIQNKNFSVFLYEVKFVFGWKGNSEPRWPKTELHSSESKPTAKKKHFSQMLFLLSSPLVQPKSQKIITLDAFLNQSKQCCVLT